MRVLYKSIATYDPTSQKNVREFVVEDGKFSSSKGKNDTIEKINGYVYPGFIDSHAHLVGTGMEKIKPSLESLKNVDEIVQIANSTDTAVLRGWDDGIIGRYPTKGELDHVLHPLIAIRKCGHIGVANEKFLKMVGVDSNDGILKENSLMHALYKIRPNEREIQKAVKYGEKEFFKYGVTSVHSDDMYSIPPNVVKKALSKAVIGVYEHHHIHSLDEMKEFLKSPDFNSIKVLVDGSLGAKTAYLKDRYSDAQTQGILNFSAVELNEIVRVADAHGIQVVAHVIGDGALQVALKAFENSSLSLRHRLVHVQVAWPDQVEKIRNLGLCADVQTQFFISDEEMALKRLGKDRLRHAYPFKKMIDEGIHVAFSSDSPVEVPDPLKGVEAAKKLGIDPSIALRAYTVEGAYQEFAENEKGGFEDGMRADFVVLSKPIENASAKVIATYKNGKKVYVASS